MKFFKFHSKLGANIGYFSLLSAILGYKTVAFEPVTANVLRIYEAMKINMLSNLIIHQGAIGEKESPTSYVFEGKP